MSASNEDCLEGLELQLAEVDMLQSMYPGPGEFTLDDPAAVADVQAVVAGDLDVSQLDTRIGFSIAVCCEDGDKKLTVDLVSLLPHTYPTTTKPQLFTRTSQMNRERHKELREDLQKHLDSLPCGDLIMGVMCDWLQSRLYQEIPHLDVKSTEVKCQGSVVEPGRRTITRLWIYSHHIFSKIKRRDIQDWGTELGLHGFCMPGKPGVMCAEGYTCDVDDFWYRIRRMQWKKICIKEQEIEETPSVSNPLASACKFPPFFELVLDARGGKGREYHMDLGMFNEYLHEHSSGHIFSLYFGVDSRQADDD